MDFTFFILILNYTKVYTFFEDTLSWNHPRFHVIISVISELQYNVLSIPASIYFSLSTQFTDGHTMKKTSDEGQNILTSLTPTTLIIMFCIFIIGLAVLSTPVRTYTTRASPCLFYYPIMFIK